MTRTRFATALLLAFVATPPSLQAQQTGGLTAVAANEAPVVTVTPAARAQITARVSVSGTLVAEEEVLVNTRVNGFAIESIAVEVGDRVQAGEQLAMLDDSALSAQLAQAQAEFARSEAAIGQAQGQIDASSAARREADSALDRQDRLRKSGTISQSAFDQAKAASDSARANLASARNGLEVAKAQRTAARSSRDLANLNLERARIIAPVAGVVSARAARLGEIATGGAGEPLFRLIRGGEVEVDVQVIETELGGIGVGDTATMNVAGVGNVDGTVRLIAPTVDARTRLGSVRIALIDKPGLRAGLSASGWIVTDRRETITVPASAVLTRNGESSVQVVADGLVETRPVVAGVLDMDGRREIIAGLTQGESVITRAGAFFIDGDRVRAMETIAAGGAK